MRWRIGILYRSVELLQLLDRHPRSEESIVASFGASRFRNVAIEDVLEACMFSGWTEAADGHICCTDAGRLLLAMDTADSKLRHQIGVLIEREAPLWASSSVQGRQALAAYAPPEAVQCFREAGLLHDQDDDVVMWWDALACKYRAAQDGAYLEIGRAGERRTVEREYRRTGRKPKWIALDFNNAGYDVISSVDEQNHSPLVIEVKASTQPWEHAYFYLSRHEWDVLKREQHSAVHLWSLDQQASLHACVNVNSLLAHVPTDMGVGSWQRCRIPFTAFCPTHD